MPFLASGPRGIGRVDLRFRSIVRKKGSIWSLGWELTQKVMVWEYPKKLMFGVKLTCENGPTAVTIIGWLIGFCYRVDERLVTFFVDASGLRMLRVPRVMGVFGV